MHMIYSNLSAVIIKVFYIIFTLQNQNHFFNHINESSLKSYIFSVCELVIIIQLPIYKNIS